MRRLSSAARVPSAGVPWRCARFVDELLRVLARSPCCCWRRGGRGRLWWLHQPLPLAGRPVDLSIEPGTLAARRRAGRGSRPACRRRRGCSTSGSAGRARRARSRPAATSSDAGTTPRRLLDKLVRGDETLRAVRLVEGWTFRQVRAELAEADGLKPTTARMSDAAADGRARRARACRRKAASSPTPTPTPRAQRRRRAAARALRAMDKRLAAAWAAARARHAAEDARRGADRWPASSRRKPARRPTARDRGGVQQPPARRHAAADRPDGDLRPGRALRRQPAQARPAGRHALQHLHRAPACRRRRSPCRARRRCWRRCSRRRPRRCTSWPAATAPASSARPSTTTTAR